MYLLKILVNMEGLILLTKHIFSHRKFYFLLIVLTMTVFFNFSGGCTNPAISTAINDEDEKDPVYPLIQPVALKEIEGDNITAIASREEKLAYVAENLADNTMEIIVCQLGPNYNINANSLIDSIPLEEINPESAQIQLSPDMDSLWLSAENNESWGLTKYKLEKEGEKEFFPLEKSKMFSQEENLVNPKISPHGKWMADWKLEGDNTILTLSHPENKEKIKLRVDHKIKNSLFWNCDGKAILYTANHEGQDRIYTINLEEHLSLNRADLEEEKEQADKFDLVILNGTVIDSRNGTVKFDHNIGIDGISIETITREIISGRKEVDAAGQVIIPELTNPQETHQAEKAEHEKYEENSVDYWIAKLSFMESPIEGADIEPTDSSLPGAPRPYRNGYHEGLDYYHNSQGELLRMGDPVLAAGKGIVIRADKDFVELEQEEREEILNEARGNENAPDKILDKLRGRQVWIYHQNNIVTRYAHLEDICDNLKIGDMVPPGQYIGSAGNSGTNSAVEGLSQGIHLHFEIWIDDQYFGCGLEPEEIRKILTEVFVSQ